MDWKKIGKRILFPHPAFTAILSVIALVLLVYGFIALETTHVFSILSYALSFYALMLVCLRVPDIIAFVRRFRRENKYYLLYRSDVQLRMNISLYGSFAFNAAYAVFQLWLGLWHHSAWFYSMACYYLLLAGMRILLARTIRNHAPGEEQAVEWHRYRLCGIMLLVMNLVLLVFILYFVYRIRVFYHHEITTIAMAAFTFASLATAIWNAVRYRQFGSPAYSAAKAISLASAAVSMLTLENAMLTTFGQGESEMFRQIILAVSGIAVILFVQGVALYMIVNATRNLRLNNSQT